MNTTKHLYGTRSGCCSSQSLIVRSREGGFVTQNCTNCGKPRSIRAHELPEETCGSCNRALEVYRNQNKNFAYRCKSCGVAHEVASIVPSWEQVFDYHGYRIETDNHRSR